MSLCPRSLTRFRLTIRCRAHTSIPGPGVGAAAPRCNTSPIVAAHRPAQTDVHGWSTSSKPGISPGRTQPMSSRRWISLSPKEQQALASMEDGLAGSDPKLASLLATFVRLASDEEMPVRENIRAIRHRATRRPHRRRHCRATDADRRDRRPRAGAALDRRARQLRHAHRTRGHPGRARHPLTPVYRRTTSISHHNTSPQQVGERFT